MDHTKKFNYFRIIGDEDGRNCFSIGYGDPDELDFIITGSADTKDDAEEACKRLNEILSRSKWIEAIQPPKDNSLVTVQMSTGAISVGRINTDGDWMVFTVKGQDIPSQTNPVTHWQPLPERKA